MIIRIMSLKENILNDLEKENLGKIYKIMKNVKNNKDLCFLKYCIKLMILLVLMCITILSTIFSHNFQFLFCFLDITHFVGIYE